MSHSTPVQSVSLNKLATKRIIANVIPTLASKIVNSSSIQLSPHKAALIANVITVSFVELELDANYIVQDVIDLCEYHLGKVRKLNQTLTELKGNGSNVLKVAESLGLVDITDVHGGSTGHYVGLTLSKKWNDLVLVPECSLPFIGKLDDANRLTNYVKGGKVKPSKLLKDSIKHLQDTTYHVHTSTLDIIKQVRGMVEAMEQCPTRDAMMAGFRDYGYVIKGCEDVAGCNVLSSEYDADTRGRLYHIACAGANPQSSDMARALYSHNVENYVSKLSVGDTVKTTDSYKMFLAELEDIAGPEKYSTPKALAFIASNPIKAMFAILTRMTNTDPAIRRDVPKKPWTLLRMAKDYMEFETTGKCDSRLGYGLDAKCSGTQYFAIIAGCEDLGEATGITTKLQSDTVDPYVRSAKVLNERGLLWANRPYIKTPYMAVQYGGSKKALMNSKDNLLNMKDFGVAEEDMEDVVFMTIEAIREALGAKITGLIEKVQFELEEMLESEDKEFITYKHTDGFKVFKPAAPRIEVCPSFSIYLGGRGNRIYFGKEGACWEVKSKQPTAEEYVRTFMVNYIQGIDALVARTAAKYAKLEGLQAFTSIHDCFRTTLADAPKMKHVMALTYKECFIDNDQHVHLMSIIGRGAKTGYKNIVTEDILNHSNSFYFCQ